MRPVITPASPTSALATIAPVCHHLLLSCSDNACGARNDPAIALCAMPRHQTHAGGTQGIPLSATSVWEPLCGRVREHGRVMLTYLCHARCHRRHATSWSRRVRGARAATTTTAVAGRVPVVGRVPSGPLGGRTGTAGPADCDSTFMTHLLAQRASRGMSPMLSATLSIADHDGMRGFPCRAASQPHQHPLHTMLVMLLNRYPIVCT